MQSLFSLIITVSQSLERPRKIFYPKVLRTLLSSEKDGLTVCTRGVSSHGLIRGHNRHKRGFTCPVSDRVMSLSESHTSPETWESKGDRDSLAVNPKGWPSRPSPVSSALYTEAGWGVGS